MLTYHLDRLPCLQEPGCVRVLQVVEAETAHASALENCLIGAGEVVRVERPEDRRFSRHPARPMDLPPTYDTGLEHCATLPAFPSARGIPVHERAPRADYGGFYDPQAQTIMLFNGDAPMLASLRTLIHETAHALHVGEYREDAHP